MIFKKIWAILFPLLYISHNSIYPKREKSSHKIVPFALANPLRGILSLYRITVSNRKKSFFKRNRGGVFKLSFLNKENSKSFSKLISVFPPKASLSIAKLCSKPESILYLLFTIITSFLINCSKGDAKKILPNPGYILGSARFQVFWSDPGVSRETAVDKGIDNEWVKFINAAEKKVDVAVYNLGRQVIIDAIVAARERGVKVRLVGDVDESPTNGYQAIFRTDIPFSVGNSTGIQHNKFAIADDKYIMMGTGNLTDTDLMMNNNNFMIIESPTLVRSYTREFEQMFFGKYAGKKEPKTTDRTHFVNGTKLELYFSPYDGEDAMNRMIELVDNAKKEITYMIFAHTHDELTTALIRAAKRGVLVRGIHDYTFIRSTSMEAPRIYNAGRFNPTGPFNKEDGNENTKTPGLRTSGGKLHCKTMIFDGNVVSTGSFNWSNNAINNNDENMLVIHSPLVANELSNQWNSIWNYGRPITNQIKHPSGDVVKPGEVVISEVNWAGSFKKGASSGSPAKEDVYIELFNTTDRIIDISHWVITWDEDEVIHYAIPDEFSWFEPGVHKIHQSRGRLEIPPKGYFLLKNANLSLPILNPTAFDNDSSDNKFSGTKNFSLSQAFLRIRLYDTNMNLIDEAGDGSPPSAGLIDPFNFRTHSMERFFDSTGKALNGKHFGSWYTSNGNDGLGTTLDPLTGKGRLSDDYSICETTKGCTVGTPNARFNSNFASSASKPRNGILGLTNIPIEAYSISATEAVIQMRWAVVSPPSVSGTNSVRISPTDSSKLIVGVNQVSGVLYTLQVNNSGLDITNKTVDGGFVSFTGFTENKAKVFISKIFPSESSANGDKIEITASSSGNTKGLGVYFFDSSTLNIPTLIYQIGDVNISEGQKILVTMNKTFLSDDKRFNQNPSININANTASQYDVYSPIGGLTSTDLILFLSYDLKKTSEDMMCYSNQDGDVSENLMKWGFRYIYKNPSNYFLDGIFPLDQVNDFEIQKNCANLISAGSGTFLERVARNRRATDFKCIGCD